MNDLSRQPHVSGDIDLADIWQAIRERWKTIAAVTIVCFGAALVYVLLATPRYAGEAKVLVENQEGYLTRQERADGAPDEQAVTSQVEVIMSRDLARQAIRQLGLAGNSEFDPVAGGGGLLRQIGGLVSGSRVAVREDRIFAEYFERLTVFALPRSRVVSIEFRSRDPALAASGANSIADLYIEMQANAKRERARAAAEALGSNVELLRTKLAEAEGQLEAFRLRTGLMVGANNSTLPTQQLAEINAQLASARTAQADSQARARLLREAVRAGRLNEVPDIANNELVRRVSEQRVTLRSQLALESRTLGPEHPRTKDLVAQISAVEGELRLLAERTSRTLENDARIAGSRMEFLLAAVERQKRAVGGSGDDEVKLRELERDARLIREQLEQSTQRWREALERQASTATPGDARVISRAVEPLSPATPKKMLAIFAGIGGLALSTFGVIAGAMLSTSATAATAAPTIPRLVPAPPIQNTEPPIQSTAPKLSMHNDVRVVAPQPETGGVPLTRIDQVVFGGRRVVAPPAEPAAPQVPEPADAIRVPAGLEHMQYVRRDGVAVLAQRMMSRPAGPEGVLALVAGVNPTAASEGALELARILASDARTVLVNLSRTIRMGRGEGLADVLDGSSSFRRCLQRDRNSTLHVLTRGTRPVEAGDDLDEALAALARTYDFVILAIGAEEEGDLVLSLAGAVDLCVIPRRGERDVDASDALFAALEESGAREIDVLDLPAPAPRGRVLEPA